jgi:ribosomal protein S18 acetylase RimI-like enzyme
MTTRVELRPMAGSDLGEAARILARRHQGHRRAQPSLPRRFEDPAACELELAASWGAEAASGAVALRGDEMVGFLLGAPRSSPMWGPNVWVEVSGQAAEESEVLRDLYGLAAARWVEEGRTAHYVLVPAHDAAVLRAWCRLGFGEQQAHAVRPVPRSAPPVPSHLTVRPARREDVRALARLDLELPAHQGRSPVFSAGEVPSLEEAVADWEEDLDDEDLAVFVAERDGEVVGSAVGCPVARSGAHAGLARPDHAALLSFAAVLPATRGLGAGRALGEAVLTWAASRGFDCVATDWRTTNLLSSRAWPALGFEETFLRLHRVVGY